MPEASAVRDAFGYVGLGDMGSAMVGALIDHNVDCLVYDLSPSAVAPLVERGAVAATDSACLARRCRVVSVCVPADEDVRAVLDGPDGVLANLEPGSTVALHSTVLPTTVRWAGEAAAERGVHFVEAPVTGGREAVAAGTLTFLLVGDTAAIDAIEPLLRACGEQRIFLDRLGDANQLKLCINLNSYASFVAAGEATRLARELGLDPARLHTAMEANGQVSPLLRNVLPLQLWDDALVGDDGMQRILASRVGIMRKDMNVLQRVVADADLRAPLLALVAEELSATFRQSA